MDIDLLSKMVKELILDKDEVSLPGVGTFVAEMVPSVFSDKGYTINPPYKRLSFRQKSTGDDSLLIDFYAKCNKLDIETASRIIREFLHEMRHVLETRKSIVFPGLGKLRATRENYFFFVADEDLDIYPEGFGLEPISLKTHEETPAEVSATMAALRGILNPEETAAGEVNVNVAPDSVHDFVTSEANAAVKINIPVREVPVSGPAVASSVETEVPSEEPGVAVDVVAESSDTESVDTGVRATVTPEVESGSGVNAGMLSGADSAADDGEAVASDVNEMASSAAKTEASAAESCSELGSDSLAAEGEDASSGVESSGAVNNSDVNAGAGSDMGTSGSQVNAAGETSASGIIDKESGVDSFESADKAIDNERSGERLDSAVQHDEAVSAGEKVSDVVAGDGVGDASVPGTAENPAAGQKADTGSNVVSGECLDTAVDVVDGQVHAAESPAAGQKVEESAVAEDAAMAAKVEESAGAVVAEAGAAATSGSDMPGTAQGNADNGSSESASPVAKPASDKSDRVIKTMSGRVSKKKPNWRKVLKWSCIGAVLLALTMLLAFIALAHIAPDFIDSILYSPDELRIINY
ncbi:MAG: hypothetical protein EGS78_11610 [Bacteroidales bacterium]|nr:hypothetical protein [Bacteroidales bacterium]